MVSPFNLMTRIFMILYHFEIHLGYYPEFTHFFLFLFLLISLEMKRSFEFIFFKIILGIVEIKVG